MFKFSQSKAVFGNKSTFNEILSYYSKMPKKSTAPKGTKGGGKGPSTGSNIAGGQEPASSNSPVKVDKNGEISISIQVKPGAKTEGITDITEVAVGVQISAPPVDGEANAAVLKYFSKLLNVKKTDVSLKGGKSRQKTVLIAASAGLTVDSVTARLKAEEDS